MVHPVGVFVFCGARAWVIGPIDLRGGLVLSLACGGVGWWRAGFRVRGIRAGRCHPAYLTTKGHEGKKCFCLVFLRGVMSAEGVEYTSYQGRGSDITTFLPLLRKAG